MYLAIDTETTGTDFFHGCKPFMCSATDGKYNYIWEGKVDPLDRSCVTWNPSPLQEIDELAEEAEFLLFHNAKFDIRALSTIGLDLTKYWDKIHDTMLASHVMCSGEKHGLKHLAFKYLGYYNDGEEALGRAVIRAREDSAHLDIARQGHATFPGLTGQNANWYKMDYWLCLEECRKYASDDVEMTYLLWQMYEDCLHHYNLWEVYEERRHLLRVTYEIQSNGLYMYADAVREEISSLQEEREAIPQQLQLDLNIKQPLDLSRKDDEEALLFRFIGIEPVEYSDKTGRPRINKETIPIFEEEYGDNPYFQKYLRWRETGTQISYLTSYLNWVADDSRIHSNLHITGTRETRQASRDPNVQNISRRLKHIFGPPPGKVWLDYDLVNIELRIWTYQVGNREMIEVFEAGDSVHLLIASVLYPDKVEKCNRDGVPFKERYDGTLYSWVKNGNFAIIYGATPRKADQTYRYNGAYEIISSRFPEVSQFSRAKTQEALNNYEKYAIPFVQCLGGYRLDVNLDEPHKACNYYIQGSAGYIVNVALNETYKSSVYQETSAAMVNTVHDSIVIEIDQDEGEDPEVQHAFKRIIEKAGERYLPSCEASYDIVYPKHSPQENMNVEASF